MVINGRQTGGSGLQDYPTPSHSPQAHLFLALGTPTANFMHGLLCCYQLLVQCLHLGLELRVGRLVHEKEAHQEDERTHGHCTADSNSVHCFCCTYVRTGGESVNVLSGNACLTVLQFCVKILSLSLCVSVCVRVCVCV